MAKTPAATSTVSPTQRARDLRAQRQDYLDAAEQIAAALKEMGAPVNGPTSRRSRGAQVLTLVPARMGPPAGSLTEMEQKILRLVRTGKTEGEVGKALRRSPHTVHVHMKSIYRKLGVHSRRQLRELSAAKTVRH